MKISFIAIIAGILFSLAGSNQDKPQTRCPILGNQVEKEFYKDYKGARVYFCCEGCVDRFKKNPDRYLRILLSKGVKLEKAVVQVTEVPQTLCPVMGGKINKEVYADYKGQRVYFCCPGCDKTFNKDPEKYISKMKAQGITVERLKKNQALCPVMGGKIDKEVFVAHKCQRIYFCCPGCDKTFSQDPEKFIRAMEADGIALDATPEKEQKG